MRERLLHRLLLRVPKATLDILGAYREALFRAIFGLELDGGKEWRRKSLGAGVNQPEHPWEVIFGVELDGGKEWRRKSLGAGVNQPEHPWEVRERLLRRLLLRVPKATLDILGAYGEALFGAIFGLELDGGKEWRRKSLGAGVNQPEHPWEVRERLPHRLLLRVPKATLDILGAYGEALFRAIFGLELDGGKEWRRKSLGAGVNQPEHLWEVRERLLHRLLLRVPKATLDILGAYGEALFRAIFGLELDGGKEWRRKSLGAGVNQPEHPWEVRERLLHRLLLRVPKATLDILGAYGEALFRAILGLELDGGKEWRRKSLGAGVNQPEHPWEVRERLLHRLLLRVPKATLDILGAYGEALFRAIFGFELDGGKEWRRKSLLHRLLLRVPKATLDILGAYGEGLFRAIFGLELDGGKEWRRKSLGAGVNQPEHPWEVRERLLHRLLLRVPKATLDILGAYGEALFRAILGLELDGGKEWRRKSLGAGVNQPEHPWEVRERLLHRLLLRVPKATLDILGAYGEVLFRAIFGLELDGGKEWRRKSLGAGVNQPEHPWEVRERLLRRLLLRVPKATLDILGAYGEALFRAILGLELDGGKEWRRKSLGAGVNQPEHPWEVRERLLHRLLLRVPKATLDILGAYGEALFRAIFGFELDGGKEWRRKSLLHRLLLRVPKATLDILGAYGEVLFRAIFGLELDGGKEWRRKSLGAGVNQPEHPWEVRERLLHRLLLRVPKATLDILGAYGEALFRAIFGFELDGGKEWRRKSLGAGVNQPEHAWEVRERLLHRLL